ncbi:hypothetical protein N9L31_00180 [bacterium]|nr:hypothetical protein [bacterium]
MIRQGDTKLIVYGPNQFEPSYPPQLFNLSSDPWELRDIAAAEPATVLRLSALLATQMNVAAIDRRAKAVQKGLFLRFAYSKHNGSRGCGALMQSIYGGAWNATDAEKFGRWLGKPCPPSE